MTPRILVTNWVHEEVLDLLATYGEVDANRTREPWPQAEVLARASGADAVMAFMTDAVDAEFLAHCPRLRIVACALKGFDNFDVDACAAAGLWATIVPDLLTSPTAELAVGLAIGLGRMIRDGDAVVRSGAFDGWRPILYGSGLDGATVTILGQGRIGRAIAARLAGFGCRLLGVDARAEMAPGVTAATLSEALPVTNYLIAALPLTEGTFHLVDAAAIAALPLGALVINIGRGSVVDEAAVVEALAAGRLGGYAADVFAMEDWALPARPRTVDARLLAHPRTLFTPHLGSAVDSVRRAIALRAAENIIDVLSDRTPRDAINTPLRFEGLAARA